jgi:hypothetical protein
MNCDESNTLFLVRHQEEEEPHMDEKKQVFNLPTTPKIHAFSKHVETPPEGDGVHKILSDKRS